LDKNNQGGPLGPTSVLKSLFLQVLWFHHTVHKNKVHN